jgi:protein-S-isoprenylcysteine O-methyltransferase Ste14
MARPVLSIFIRSFTFTVLVPGSVTVLLPRLVYQPGRALTDTVGPARHLGWPLLLIGVAGYVWCAAEFALRGRGTPAIWFTRPLRFLIGEEPSALVRASVYRWCRNPMYLAVVTVLLGEAVLFASPDLLAFAGAVWLVFHMVVVFIEEPHLHRAHGETYDRYCREVGRWMPRRSRRSG